MSVNFEASIVGPWVLEWLVLVLFLAAGGILTRATIGTRNPELSIGTIGAAQTDRDAGRDVPHRQTLQSVIYVHIHPKSKDISGMGRVHSLRVGALIKVYRHHPAYYFFHWVKLD